MDNIIKGIGFLFESVTSFGQTVKEKFTEGQEEKRNKENLRRKHDQENKNLKKVTSEMKPTVESEKLKSQTDRNKNNNNRWVVFNKPDFFENPKGAY
jgi:dephospho-CoA kinase